METIGNISVEELTRFIEVARRGSFAAAARELGLTRSAVSRSVASLEGQLGARLFKRSTRHLALTAAGTALRADLQPLMPRLVGSLRDASSSDTVPRGSVRLSVSHAFGRTFVLPALAELLEKAPELSIDLDLSDQVRNLIADDVDLAVRLGPLPNSSMIARRLGRLKLVLVGAPKLVASLANTRRTPEQLASAPSIAFRVPSTGRLAPWRFAKRGAVLQLEPRAPRAVTDSVEGLCDLVHLGLGLGQLPRYLVADSLTCGHLVEAAPAGPGPEAHLCYAGAQTLPRRVAFTRDHLLLTLRAGLADK